MRKQLIAAVCLCSLTGCFWKPTKIVIQPDSPVLILERRGDWIRGAVWSEERKALIEPDGWMPLSDFEDWTLTPYDWEARRVRERENDTDNR